MKEQKSKRGRAFTRHQRYRVIARKKKIVKQGYWYVPDAQYGRLAKGKIHCSCPICSQKTRMWGYPKSQQAVIEGQLQQLKEAGVEGNDLSTFSSEMACAIIWTTISCEGAYI